MRKLIALTAVLAPALWLGACGDKTAQPPPAETPAATAPTAPTPIDPAPATPAPSSPPKSAPLPPLDPPEPGQPGGLPDDRTPVAEGPIRPGGAQDAANVVQTYYALLESGRYTQAWALWDRGGQASGLSAADFARSFGQYAEYHANIGAPGRVDAGAGQRYVTVPVQVYGRLKDGGRPFNQRGEVTLHRTADIDGATAEQKSWRISDSDLKPRPDAPAPPPPRGRDHDDRPGRPQASTPAPGPAPGQPDFVTARYRCEGGLDLVIDFDNRAGTATVRGGGRKSRAVMARQPSGSGIHYAGNGYDLRGKGNEATWTSPGAQPVACRSGR